MKWAARSVGICSGVCTSTGVMHALWHVKTSPDLTVQGLVAPQRPEESLNEGVGSDRLSCCIGLLILLFGRVCNEGSTCHNNRLLRGMRAFSSEPELLRSAHGSRCLHLELTSWSNSKSLSGQNASQLLKSPALICNHTSRSTAARPPWDSPCFSRWIRDRSECWQCVADAGHLMLQVHC